MTDLAVIPSSAELLAQQQPAEQGTLKKELKFYTTDAHELEAVQGQMTAWVKMKLDELAAQIVEFEHERDIAKENHWAVPPWTRQISKAERRVEYYQKMQAIMEAGYVMVPAMAMDLFAVRTNKQFLRGGSTYHQPTAEKRPEELSPAPIGEGRHVGAKANIVSFQNSTRDAAGKIIDTQWHYRADSFQDVAFPLDVAKPEIMEGAAAAMALKAFDEIGVVRPKFQRRGDPFIVGRIRDPRPNKPGVSFFIGWHINMADL